MLTLAATRAPTALDPGDPMTTRRTSTLAAGIAVAALLLVGCGGDDDDSSNGDGGGGGNRPSVEELTEKLAATDDITDEQAECVAGAYVDSDISDDGLNSLLESGGLSGLEDSDLSDGDRAAIEAAANEAAACTTAALPTSTTTG